MLSVFISACTIPDTPYRFDGTFYEHGWIHANDTMIFECSDNREFETRCIADSGSDSLHGVWEPAIYCPTPLGE